MIELALHSTVHLSADRERAVLSIADLATFEIEGGEVSVEPETGVEAGSVDAWRDGLVTALALAQRGCFALHASLVEVDGVAVALAGTQGAGKSTTSLLLTQRGATLLGDDVLPLDGGRYATTGRPLHVAPHTATLLGVDVASAERLTIGREKLALPLRPGTAGDLGALVVLKLGGETLERRRLTGIAAVQAVRENTYRLPILSRLWEADLFEWAGQVAAAVAVHVVHRPADRWSGDEVAAAVEAVAGG